MTSSRLIAYRILCDVERGGYAADLLYASLRELDSRDAGLAEEIVFGVLRFQAQLDFLIRHYAGRDPARLDAEVRIALRMGIYQLRYLERIPPHAAVSEAVESVRRARKASAAGFVNAVLRKVKREPVAWPDPATGLSHPAWMLERFERQYGADAAAAIARANLVKPETYIRVPAGQPPPEGAEPCADVAGCYRQGAENAPSRSRLGTEDPVAGTGKPSRAREQAGARSSETEDPAAGTGKPSRAREQAGARSSETEDPAAGTGKPSHARQQAEARSSETEDPVAGTGKPSRAREQAGARSSETEDPAAGTGKPSRAREQAGARSSETEDPAVGTGKPSRAREQAVARTFTTPDFRIQDIGSQAIVPLLDLQPGQRFLDLCAAPGNKTAQALETGVKVIACDIHLHRLQALRGLPVDLVVLDATAPLPFGCTFDRILIDAPCSGTGTLARNPEIKWRLKPADIQALAARQSAILANALQVLAPGGRLVYSTCSLEREENEDIVAPYPVIHILRRLPGRDPGDGFFAAVIESGLARK